MGMNERRNCAGETKLAAETFYRDYRRFLNLGAKLCRNVRLGDTCHGGVSRSSA
jgi:hypothetical protein